MIMSYSLQEIRDPYIEFQVAWFCWVEEENDIKFLCLEAFISIKEWDHENNRQQKSVAETIIHSNFIQKEN